jgi:fructose-1,6-bisphosphatase/inositol monophosphatase family enzyme
MNEMLKKKLTAAVIETGNFANSHRQKSQIADIERKMKDSLSRRMKDVDPAISLWGEGSPAEAERMLVFSGIDSYVNFSRGFGDFGLIATIYEQGRAELGVIYCPKREGVLVAEAGKGTRIDGSKARVSGISDPRKAIICCDFSSLTHDESVFGYEMLERMVKEIPGWRNLGSPARGFMLMSQGLIDGMVIGISETEQGAGYLAMKEAGALVTDRRGRPVSLESDSVIAANPELHEALLEMLGK